MATHLAAWQQSIDSAVLAAITTVTDDVLTRSGTLRYLVPPDYRFIRWAIASGPNVTRAQIVSPSLGVRRMNQEIVPRRRGASTLTLTGPEIYFPARPLELLPSEEIEAQVAEDAAGASQVNVIAALSAEALPAMPAGDIRRVRATATTALTAFAWTTVSMTLDTSLEPGTYSLVNFIPISANILAARAIITGQQYRPGVPGLAGTEAAAVDFDDALLRQVSYYAMGSFTHITVPQIQFFAAVADAAETVFFDVVRTGAAPTGAPA